MNMADTIVVLVLALLALVAFGISYCSFKEEGFLFNNAYIFASEQERATLNKSPYYRQSAIIFLAIGVCYVLNAIEVAFDAWWLLYVILGIAVVTVVYAIVSTKKIKEEN